MRCLIIDQEGLGLDMVLRLVDQENEVRWYKQPEKGRRDRSGEGMRGFKIVESWQDSMPWARAGLIFCTGNFVHIYELDRFRDIGYKIFGPTVKSAELEIKRSVGMKAMEAVGIEVPPYQEFGSFDEALAFAKKSDECWVLKTLGSESDKSLTFVSCDPAEMCGWIQNKIDRGMVLQGGCILQSKIDLVAEMGVSGWVGPDGFLPGKFQIAFEHKKLCNEEIGPQTGEMATVCQYSEQDKLAADCLLPMESIVKVLGHRGDFAIGVGIDSKGRAWPMEFTARAGWPAYYIQVASHKGNISQWMRDLLDGKDTLKVDRRVSIGVVMAQPFFPYSKSPPEIIEGNPIAGVDDVMDDVHFAAVMVGPGYMMKDGRVAKGPIFQTCGEYVLCATGLGNTIDRARKAVYDTVGQIKFPNSIYRTDAGLKVQKALPTLHRFGYALDMLA